MEHMTITEEAITPLEELDVVLDLLTCLADQGQKEITIPAAGLAGLSCMMRRQVRAVLAAAVFVPR